MKKLVKGYLPLVLHRFFSAAVAFGAIVLWRRQVMWPGGAYLTVVICVMYVLVINRVEAIRAELLAALAKKASTQ